jgi:hypothetical protein
LLPICAQTHDRFEVASVRQSALSVAFRSTLDGSQFHRYASQPEDAAHQCLCQRADMENIGRSGAFVSQDGTDLWAGDG